MEKCLLCGNVVDHSISKICIDCIKKEYSLSNKDLTNVKQCPKCQGYGMLFVENSLYPVACSLCNETGVVLKQTVIGEV